METFANRLKNALEIKKISQTELSKRTGIDKSLISNYVSGKYKAKSQNLYAIASALGVAEAWLMGYDIPMEKEVPAIKDNSGHINEFARLFQELTEDQQSLIIAQIKGILSSRE